MKASDITDAQFLDAMRVAHELRPGWWVTRWDHQAVLEGRNEFVEATAEGDRRHWPVDYQPEWPEFTIPEKIYLAKMRKLIKRRVIDGCACGCRGDLTIVGEDWDAWRSDHPDHAEWLARRDADVG